jgi:ADP-ribosylation factor GTPase-activating protein 1
VEGNAGGSSGAYRTAPLDESKKDFWDSFAEAGQKSAIGTSAVKKTGGFGGGGVGGKGKTEEDNWDKW